MKSFHIQVSKIYKIIFKYEKQLLNMEMIS